MPATILTAKGRELRDALEIVSSAVSRDHSRPMLTAINLRPVRDHSELVRVAATDSYRLHVATIRATHELPEEGVSIAELKPTMIPAKRAYVDHSIVREGEHVSIGDKNGARVVEGAFPNVEQLRPDWWDAPPFGLSFVPSDELYAFCKLAERATSNDRNYVAMRGEVDDDANMTLTQPTPFGDLSLVVRCEMRGEQPERWGMRPGYFADACAAIGGRIEIRGTGPQRPFLFCSAGSTSPLAPWALVMPIRLA